MPDPFIPKVVPITGETVIDSSPSLHLDPSTVLLPEGNAFCKEAVSLTIVTASLPEIGETIIIVIAAADHEGGRLGSLSPMTPTQARNFAASLIQSANLIDGGANG